MAIPTHSLMPAYLTQFELPHSEQYDVIPTQLSYTPHYTPDGADETSAFTEQAQALSGHDVATHHHALQPSSFTALHSVHTQSDVALAGSSQSAPSAMRTSHASATEPLHRPRKRKAVTLRADDWEPYKERILELHIEQKRPLPEVRQTLEKEYGFKADQWVKDKNVKPQEMQAIVRKRQKRKLVETDKGQLAFEVRGNEVELQKIERWMKRHDVVASALYAPSPAAPTPSDVGCYTIMERGSHATTTKSMYSPVASFLSPGYMYPTGQSPQMPSPALSMSSPVRPQTSVFTRQSPALSHQVLPNLDASFVYGASSPGSATDVDAQIRYRQDEEHHLRYQILEAEMSPNSGTVAISDLLYHLGRVLFAQGRYMAAEDIIRKLVEVHESHSGGSDDGLDALEALNLLGQALEGQGLYVEAERLFRQALQGRERMLTIEHPHTLTTMDNLARVWSNQGRLRDAEEQNTKVQALCMRVLGPDHALTLRSMSNSARVLETLGRYEEARLMLSKILVSQERVLGFKDPETLASMRSLAQVLCRQGLYEEAEIQAQTTLGLYKEVVGSEHPDTLGLYKEVVGSEHPDTLGLYKEVVGSEHPDTLGSQLTLAEVLEHQAKYEDMEAMHRETLAFCQKVFRPEHPNMLVSMSSWGNALYRRGRYKEAEAKLSETTSTCNKVLGPEHPETLVARSCLVRVLHKQGRSDEAKAMGREVVSLFKKVLGPEHPDTLTA